MISTIFEEAQSHSSSFCLTEQLGTPCYVFENEKTDEDIEMLYKSELDIARYEDELDERTVNEANNILASFISPDIAIPYISNTHDSHEMLAWIRAYCR